MISMNRLRIYTTFDRGQENHSIAKDTDGSSNERMTNARGVESNFTDEDASHFYYSTYTLEFANLI